MNKGRRRAGGRDWAKRKDSEQREKEGRGGRDWAKRKDSEQREKGGEGEIGRRERTLYKGRMRL